MRKSKRNWNKLYQTYLKTYNRKENRSKVGMEQRYSFHEFQAMYTALENDRRVEIKKGLRKVANITQDLVAKQELFEYSTKQARVLRDALKEQYGETFKVKDIKMGLVGKTPEFWTVVKDFREQLMKSGVSSGEASDMISSTFFGS